MAKHLILALTPDIVRVLQGDTMGFETEDGIKVDLRLMTADEYEEWIRDYDARNPGGPGVPPRHRIEELTRRLPKF